jgi:hypothetical protein
MTDPIRARLDYLLGEADLGAPELHDALRAVLDLHRPEPVKPHVYCVECTDDESAFGGVFHPCNTVRAIAESLGVSND